MDLSAYGWYIALALVIAYALAVFLLYRARRIGPEKSLTLFGPALMVKTQRGRTLLDRWGRFRRFWAVAGDLGVLLAAVAMATIVGLLVLDAAIATRIPASAAPTVQQALGIPGINPIIPLGYGLVALIVGVVLHELFHGIVARSQGIRVKSLGILWLVIPVGAFVEQDDQEMLAATRRKRDRVAAAGVLANFALAVAFFLVLSLVLTVGVQPNAQGVGIGYVLPGTPAANASLAAGDIITAVNGTPTTTNTALLDVLGTAHAGQAVRIDYYSAAAHAARSQVVTLTSLAWYTHVPADSAKGFLGVSPTFLTPADLKTELAAPVASSAGPLIGVTDWLILPLAGLEPVAAPTTSFFHLTGVFAGSDPGSFWIGVNLLYWLAWMNLLLGLSNALPLFPLDGGLLFRDFSAGLAARLRKGWDAARLDRFAGRAVAASSLLVVFLLVWQFVGPRL